MIITLLLLLLLGRCCPSGEYYNGTSSSCAACESSCQTCASSTSCLTCEPGEYLLASRCASCPTACSTCLTSVACTSCAAGFYLNSSSATCDLCYSNCLSCSASSCAKCNAGFYPNGKDCVSCQISCDCSGGTLRNCPATNGMLIVIIITPILALASILLVYCIARKRCREASQNSQEPNDTDADPSNSISYGLKLIGVLLNMKKKNWVISENGEKIDLNEICSICLHKKPNLKTKCQHHFHMKCLSQWLKQRQTCPICKGSCSKDLKKYCQACHQNFILFNAKTAGKYNTSLFDICPYCQSLNQTQQSFR